ncbi:uncharacterized protein I303_104474 [Kwoniella dejecticola CBS 10117]|uniref:Zn(2)-C6 fungal-type domain-containing protein n=1 Tax=Kwoniella dejecticola CBS 10117 TaxID=1296121 RepID=A0A1A6A574_9TREE|nr:uncharacterized protein I303_04548 [Kwoniella dejecticola CBS 10117]OBR85215.1 hypothetical protein I303_04548 [Kwoniella dejecticola CBS 10117]
MPAATKTRPLARGDACQACKSRKVRCPAQKPACANCVRKNRECIYQPVTRRDRAPLSRSESNEQAHPPIPHHSFSYDPFPQSGESSSSNNAPSGSSFTAPSQNSYSLDPSLLLAPPQPAMTPNEDNWMQGMVGLLPPMMGSLQDLPAPWDSVDITALLGGQLAGNMQDINQKELSEIERDHLLLLYFTGQRLMGVDMHISSFYKRLQSTEPLERPHPCLLNAIYLMTCRQSPLESLRKQEKTFFTRAKQLIDEALASEHSIFDAIRAGTMVVTYLFGLNRQREGWAIMGQTIGLAVAVGLDRIESSVDLDNITKMTAAETYLPRATTHVELADRIYAFWTLYLVHKCVCVGFELSSGFDLGRITTPLPRPWEEYETADSHLSTCDRRITDIFDSTSTFHSCDEKHIPEFGYLLCAAELMHQVSLRPKERAEQERLESSLKMLNSNIPPELKKTEKDEEGRPTIRSDTATLQLITLCTEMFLYSLDRSLGRPDPRALEVARRILGILHLLKDSGIGDINVFAIIIWVRVACLLVWESKRLEAAGDAFTAASYEKDVQFICNTLQNMSHIKLAASCLEAIQSLWAADVSIFTSPNGLPEI